MRRSVRAFLDTNILKYATDERLVYVPRVRKVIWGDQQHEVTAHTPTVIHPNKKLDAGLRAEVAELPFIAFLAHRKRIELLCHGEVVIELMGLPRTTDRRGLFYGAPIKMSPDPIPYGRIVMGDVALPQQPRGVKNPLNAAKLRQVDFIQHLADPRILALRKACNADTRHGVNPNQLIDAFHLWCAEAAGATHFLTAERSLLELGNDRSLALKCTPVLPSQLVRAAVRSVASRGILRFALRMDIVRNPTRWHVAA